MLEIQNLSKIYRPKKGLPVTALNSVSLTFPDQGMVFLLGKSGSGKSTLLNLLGGLDSYDSGDIIISGTSTCAFRQSGFDSYRNTMVGFIFQEYNVLEEFTVGANIALALELQGKRATDEEINRILQEVDLVGYGNRSPNELSGGQKQRVAIARALVKNPKIIMADEPTGALDSVTGKQVFDTLKRLSQEKLVIVVSHDRDFAMRYADRIVELADGCVISDEEYSSEEVAFSEKGITYGEDAITLSAGYRLTEEDRLQINQYLEALSEGKSVTLKAASPLCRTSKKPGQPQKEAKKEPLKLIPSHLPLKAAFRIGCGALKYKKVRLVFTILLSCIAFGLFGLADTFGAYDHITTCTQSILDSGIRYLALNRQERVENPDGTFYYRHGGNLTDEELKTIAEETGVPVSGVYRPLNTSLEFQQYYDTKAEFTKSDYHIYPYAFNGFAEIGDEMNLKLLAGEFPDGEKNEIAVTSYILETFRIGGFRSDENQKELTYDPISAPADLVGRKMVLGGVEYTVSGVVESSVDLDRYRPLTEKDDNVTTAEMLLDYALYSELSGIREYSLEQVALVGQGHLKSMVEDTPRFWEMRNGHVEFFREEESGDRFHLRGEYYGILDQVKRLPIFWLNGEKTQLAENEILVSSDFLTNYAGYYPEDPEAYDPETGELLLSKLSKAETDRLIQFIEKMGTYTAEAFDYTMKEWNDRKIVKDVRIVGFLSNEGKYPLRNVIIASESILLPLVQQNDGIYSYAVGDMPQKVSDVRDVVTYCYREDSPVRYRLQNPVTFELDAIHEVLVVLSEVFLYVGIAFAVFASMMLTNFISTSIVYKKQQIGILRAIGARSNDVFRIFFSESFVIAMINFILSAAGTFTVVTLINYFIRSETGILITPLAFTIRQGALLFGVSLLVAALASFFPVKKIAAKKPIDAIRGR